MTAVPFESSSLFSTEHGAVSRSAPDRCRVTLGERTWTVSSDGVHALHEVLEPLAAQAYHCNCDCRWQVRPGGHETLVLSTDEVLRLHALLDGAVAMLELDALLDEVGVSVRASRAEGRE